MTHHTHNPVKSGTVNTGITGSDLNDPTGQFSILSQVREGMGIYDVRDNHIGNVDFVHFGAASETQQELGTGPSTATVADSPQMREDSIIDNIAEAFSPDEVPQQLSEKLLLSGYVRMDTAGLFASDRFITPDQIVRVEDDRVYLSVNRDQLVKRS
jgi:hypothetical protein